MLEMAPYLIGGSGLLFTAVTVGYNISNNGKKENYVKKDDCNKYQIDMLKEVADIKVLISRIAGKLEANDN
mgnify:CR=1 FL=1